MNFILTLSFLAIAPFASALVDSQSVNDCSSFKDIGAAYVDEPNFSENMRELRSTCQEYNSNTQIAEIVWVQYDHSYVCRVGSNCRTPR